MKKRVDTLESTLKDIISSNQDKLTKAKSTYFQRSIKSHLRLPIFYGLPKVHKILMSLRPAVSSTKSLLAVFSIWLDYKIKELIPLVYSYLKDSSSLIQDIKNIHTKKCSGFYS